MAFLFHEFIVPAIPPGIARSSVIPVQLPQGSIMEGVQLVPGNPNGRLIVRGDLSQNLVTYRFVVVRSDVFLTAEEAAAERVGSVPGYRTEAGFDLYHILRLP